METVMIISGGFIAVISGIRMIDKTENKSELRDLIGGCVLAVSGALIDFLSK